MTEAENYLREISEGDPLSFLAPKICPYLIGREWEWIRKAMLLMMVTQRDTHTRSRLHMIISGLPGTGKSEFLLYVREHLQGVLINAELTSKVGLVGDARGNDITPGLLANLSGHVLLCDELDKMSSVDSNGLLQAMEEGRYTIIKGKSRENFKAEVRVVAATNTLRKIQGPLLDRFDFVLFVRPPKREERADNVPRIIDSFVNREENKYIKVIKTYINWLGDADTSIIPDERPEIDELIKNYILETQTRIKQVSYRSLELSIMRIAYAMARLERKNIGRIHVENAQILKDQMLKNLVGSEKHGRKNR